ncbi:HAD family hydrolase [Phaeospirillum tilakii]|uniref:HAD family hydrolase n=1 Tax=Phaeospirillum tilakii TaxID=741673 RepID=A0ABW5CBT8_9PROT
MTDRAGDSRPFPQPQAVIFDMDGLLFNTEDLYRDAVMAAAAASGIELPLSVYLSLLGLSGEAARDALRERFGPGFAFDAFWAAARRNFEETLDDALRLKPGAVELLDALDAAGLPAAIATSSLRASVDHHLAAFGLDQRFAAIVAKGDTPRGKPHPDPFLSAAARLGIEPARCLVLEDSHNGVRGAARAGMLPVMVPDLLAATAEMEALCVAIVPDLHRVRALLWPDAPAGRPQDATNKPDRS